MASFTAAVRHAYTIEVYSRFFQTLVKKKQMYHSYIITIALCIILYVCNACVHTSHHILTYHIASHTYSKISNHIIEVTNLMRRRRRRISKNETCKWHLSSSVCVLIVSIIHQFESQFITIRNAIRARK